MAQKDLQDHGIDVGDDWEEVRDPDSGDLQGWMVPRSDGRGALFRAIPGGKHPNHRPGPGRTRKSVRQKLLRLTDYGADQLLRALEEGLVCRECKAKLATREGKDALTLRDLLQVLDKGGKFALGAPTDDDEGQPLLRPVVALPALDE